MIKPRNNPFAAHRIDSLDYRFTHLDWARLLNTLKSLNYRASIVGPQGSGKTTLLGQLSFRLENQGIEPYEVFINESKPYLGLDDIEKIFRDIQKNTVIFLDGADLLPRWQWKLVKLLSIKGKGLIIACHQLDYLPILMQCQPTLTILDDVMTELVGSVGEDLNEKSHKLFYQYNGNIREVFRDLYMLYANQ